MRLIIAGSRHLPETLESVSRLDKTLVRFRWNSPDVVMCGCASGADSVGKMWAVGRGIRVEEFPAEWKKYGKAAGPIRNELMATEATHLLAIWDGKSRGTKNMIENAVKYGLQYRVARTGDR